MSEFRQYQARTLEVALSKAARDLGVSLDSVRYEMVFDGRKGLFGFGQKDVVIQVSVAEMEKVRLSPPPVAEKAGVGPVGRQFPEERRVSSKGPQEGGFVERGHDDRPPRRGEDRGYGSPRSSREDGPRRERGYGPGRGRDQRPEGPGSRGGRPARGFRDRETADHGSAGPHWEPRESPPLPTTPPKTPQGQTLLESGRKVIALMALELECAVEERATGNGRPEELVLLMRGADDRLIIGRHGDVLDAFQYLLGRMFVKDAAFEGIRISVDCSGYRHRHDQDLEERARGVADRVRRSGIAVQLEPMNPYQRRIVHLALREEPGIKTFSTGEGFLRRLTIGLSDQH